MVVILPARLQWGEMKRMSLFMNAGILKPRPLNSRKYFRAESNFASNALPAAPFLLASLAYGLCILSRFRQRA